MIKILWLILTAVGIIFAEDLVITSQRLCDKRFSLDVIKSIYISYEGHPLGSEPCATRFDLVDTFNYTICVRPIVLQLDCNTKIEYQNHFVADSINDGELTCTMNKHGTFNESCDPFLSTFYIVIKRDDPYRNLYENVKIHVYTKERQYKRNYASHSPSTYWIGSVYIVPAIIIVVIVCAVIYTHRKRRLQRQYSSTQVSYHTAVGPTTVPTGGYVPNTDNTYPGTIAYQQALLPQSGNQPQMIPTDPTSGGLPVGGYYVHPAVTAYPASNQQTSGLYNYQPVPYNEVQTSHVPTAPPRQDNSALPSYESLMKK